MIFSPDRPVQMRVYSVPSHLRVVRAAIEKVCELVDLDDAAAGRIVLSVDEALTNVIRHAYGEAEDKPIDVSIALVGEESDAALEIRLRDFGPPVDPSQIRGRDLADVRPGGLGVHIIQECMDVVEYRPAEGGGTLLVLRRALTGGQAGDGT